MKKILTALLVLLIPGTASALSCMPPSPELTLTFALDSPNTPTIIIANAEVIRPPSISQDRANAQWEQTQKNSMSGNGFLKSTKLNTFTVPLAITPIQGVSDGILSIAEIDPILEVEVLQSCAGPWCSGLPLQFFESGATVTVALEQDVKDKKTWKIITSPCGGTIFPSLTPEETETLRSFSPEK